MRRMMRGATVLAAMLVATTAGARQGPPADPAVSAPPAAATPAAPPATPAVPAAPAPPAPVARTVPVLLTTARGPITIAVEVERAPVTASNFLRYVDAKRFDGVTLYRAVKVAPGAGLVQGGIENDPKRAFPPVAHEPTSRTHLSHTDGAVSMARGAPGSATGDFFIVVGDFPTMDAQPAGSGDIQGFAVFGHVTAGMDLVRAMLDAPTSPTKGDGVMKGTMLLEPIRILTARRAPAG